METLVQNLGSLALMQHLPDLGYFAKDKEGRFMAANQAFAEIAGFKDPARVVGKTDFDLWPQFLADHYIKDDLQVMETQLHLVNKIELVIRQDRSTDWFATTKVPLFSPENEICGVEGYCRYLKKAKAQPDQALRLPMVIDHIMENYARKIEIPALAAMVSLSVKQFERKFKQEYGDVPIRYIQRIRLDAASQLLVMTRLTIAQVSRETGFYDSSHFSNQFYKYTGDTPKAFRLKHIKAPQKEIEWKGKF
jgi:AraC-like DNA-binding protein